MSFRKVFDMDGQFYTINRLTDKQRLWDSSVTHPVWFDFILADSFDAFDKIAYGATVKILGVEFIVLEVDHYSGGALIARRSPDIEAWAVYSALRRIMQAFGYWERKGRAKPLTAALRALEAHDEN